LFCHKILDIFEMGFDNFIKAKLINNTFSKITMKVLTI